MGRPRTDSMSTSSSEGECGRQVKRQKRSEAEVVEETAGNIKRIELVDFMCHARLDLELTKKITFLTGPNGSGKSSVLQAITIGLGSNAASTKRGLKQLKHFIRTGCDKAVIKITLSNEGENAWKTEDYGSAITFHRELLSSGSSKFFLRNSRGEVMYKDKEARNKSAEILDDFKIYVDNPIIILQQETAKEMLNVEKPDKLYNLFMKVTELEPSKAYILASNTELKMAQEAVSRSYGQIEASQRRQKELKVQKLELVQNNQKRLEHHKVTCQVEFKEVQAKVIQISEVESRIEEMELNTEDLKRNLLAQHKENYSIMSELEKVEDKVAQYNLYCEKEERDLRELREQEAELKNKLKMFANELREVEVMLHEKRQEQEYIEKSFSTNSDPAKLKSQSKAREELEQELAQVDQEIRLTEAQVSSVGEKEQKFKDDLKNMEHQLRAKEKEIQELEDQLKSSRNHRNDLSADSTTPSAEVAVYGRPAHRLHKSVLQQLNCFKQPPLGPVGHYVKLKTETESQAKMIETYIGPQALQAYVCDNGDDARELKRIMKECNIQPRPHIYVSRFLTEQHKVQSPVGTANLPKFDSILQLLEIDNVNIFNHLVDQFRVEKVVLCGKDQDANRLTSRQKNVPVHLMMAIAPGTAENIAYKHHPATKHMGYRTYYVELQSELRLRRKDHGALQQHDLQINRAAGTLRIGGPNNGLKQLTEEKFREKLQLKNEIARLQREMQEQNRIKNAANENYKNARIRKTKVLNEQNSLSPVTPSLEDYKGRISRLEVEINEWTTKELQLRDEQEKQDVELKSVASKAKSCQKKLAVKQKEHLQHEDLNKILIYKTELQSRKAGATSELEKKETELKLLKNRTAIEKKRLPPLNQSLEKIVEKAEKKLEGLKLTDNDEIRQYREPKDSLEVLKSREHLLRKEAEKNLTKTIENTAINEEYMKIKLRLKSMKEDNDTNKAFLRDLEEQIEERTAKYMQIKSLVVNWTIRTFNSLVRRFDKEFQGNVKLDVQPSERVVKFYFSEETEQGPGLHKDISSLSGGEKAYLQMCFILAIWKSVGSTVRALDEWDVFMDAVSRKRISKEMINAALKTTGFQYIFISPQGSADFRASISHEDWKYIEIIEIKKEH